MTYNLSYGLLTKDFAGGLSLYLKISEYQESLDDLSFMRPGLGLRLVCLDIVLTCIALLAFAAVGGSLLEEHGASH